MLKLEATLIAWTPARPWRHGWSPERGVDFIVWSPGRRRTADGSTATARIAAAEPVSFVEADEMLPTGVTVVRRFVSLVAEVARPEPAERSLTRAWSAVARKLPDS
ncbi:hypothetical protein [Brevundimonas sp. Root1423]|uniref:hypothetical protein n=1 Tax=Brevundimonas sp. Root1423 TaxID=1736462 RepID=UPI0006FA4426|nr:hypothetical protein [Brevundimonas sp. Root1423]KQY80380.1 hypothetical protein ASD25_09545 [Brevundimonas sp. Root1423]